MKLVMIIVKSEKNAKISEILSKSRYSVPYSVIMKLLRNKDIKVNGKRVKNDLHVLIGDEIIAYYTPENKKAEIIYKDDNILVAFKSRSITSEDFFMNLRKDYPSLGFIHRLDRNTSGIMIFSLNDVSEKELLYGFKYRTFDKSYYAEVYGKMPKSEGVVKGYLKKDSENSTVKIFSNKVDGSFNIITGYKVLEEKKDSTLLEVKLFTGKTHQIRAHLAFIGHFIIGDGKYGDNDINKRFNAKFQRLTAYKLVLHFSNLSPLFYLDGKCFSVVNKLDF